MKNLILLVLSIFLILSCSKESALVNEGIAEETIRLSNLSVAAVYAGGASSTTAPTEQSHSCGANYVENTHIALFYEQEGITSESSMASANYASNTGSGAAYFNDIKPGKYTILASNEMGAKVKISTVTVGNNDLFIEF